MEFLRKTNGPLEVAGVFEASPASRALFARLDTNHDERLSAGECEHAFDTLHPLDLDEADMFTQNQLMTETDRSSGYARPKRAQQRATPVRLTVKVLQFSTAEPSLAWADRAGQHFALAGSTKATVASELRRAVMLHDDATFAAIDTDGNGALNRDELGHLMRNSIPNLEMVVNLSDQGTVEATAVRLDRAFRFDPAVRSEEPDRPATLTAGSELVEMTAGGFVDGSSGDRSGQVADLKQFDQDQNGYLDEREARQIGQLDFKLLDSNGDGKLYFDEIEQYVNAQSAAAAVRLVVGVVDHDHALFEALDTNGDGRLGRRELRRLADRLKAWDRDGDGQLAFDEVPRRYTLRVAQDQPRLPFDQLYSLTLNSAAVTGYRSKSAPPWFTEMDRNSDGDISRREFLGTAAQFRQLDADGDQLIDPDEAMRATPASQAATPASETAPPAGAPATDGSE